MGVFLAFFCTRNKQKNRTSGSGFAFYLGSLTSGETITERCASATIMALDRVICRGNDCRSSVYGNRCLLFYKFV